MEDANDAEEQQSLMLGSEALEPQQIRHPMLLCKNCKALARTLALQELYKVVNALPYETNCTGQTWVGLSALMLLCQAGL